MKKINVDGVKYTPKELEELIERNGYSRQWEDDEEELGVCEMINPENEQHLITAICEKEEIAYNEAKVATTATTQYHNWTAEFPPDFELPVYDEETAAEFEIRLEENLAEYEKEAKKRYPVIIGIDRESVEVNDSEEEYKVRFNWIIEYPY